MSSIEIESHVTTDSLGNGLCSHLERLVAKSIATNGRCVIGLSGGSLPKILGMKTSQSSLIDWTRCFFIFADERCTSSLLHPDSNYAACQSEFFSKLPLLPPHHVFPVDPSLHLDPAQMAASYQTTLLNLFNSSSSSSSSASSSSASSSSSSDIPRIDILLLGMGPDGHTCSLFPSHPLLKETTLLVAPIFDSPKPPPTRVTLTLPVVNAARHVVFVCTGESKAQVLKEVLEGNGLAELVPSKLVRPTEGSLLWLIDEPAAALLSATPVKHIN